MSTSVRGFATLKMKSQRVILLVLLLGLLTERLVAQNKTLSEAVAATAMNELWRDPAKNESGQPAKWTYDHGVVLKGIEGLWLSTADGEYFRFIQQGMDHFVDKDGSIKTYS